MPLTLRREEKDAQREREKEKEREEEDQHVISTNTGERKPKGGEKKAKNDH